MTVEVVLWFLHTHVHMCTYMPCTHAHIGTHVKTGHVKVESAISVNHFGEVKFLFS